jgi:RNA polymerase sigma-70 factor (ECF subfamily)
MVYTLAFRILGSREEAEDAAQEIFVKCFRALKSYNGKAAFTTWLYKIAYNHAIDMVKRKNRKGQIIEWENKIEPGIVTHHSVEEKMDIRNVKVVLKEAIGRLAPDDQVIVTLYYYEDLPLKEIAEVLGIRENHVKIKLHRIREKLLKLLKTKNEIISILNL